MLTLTLRTDGACRGNPGPSAAGYVVEYQGKWIGRGGTYLGDNLTNNQAEYRALIIGLKKVARRYPMAQAVTVMLDSKLVVMQVAGAWKCKDEALRPLRDEAAALLAQLNGTIAWNPREDNKMADEMANRVFDLHADTDVEEAQA